MVQAVNTYNLSKEYKDKLALDGVNLSIDQGEIYGLVGPNGAGKSTLLKILNGQIYASSGSYEIFGNREQAGYQVGSMIEQVGFYPNMTARQNMQVKADYLGLKEKDQIEELLMEVGLADAMDRKTKNFSIGMKQKLGLALALLGGPDLLILDEPTNGMDPQSMAAFRQLMVKLKQERGMTIIISSHILDELAKYATSFGFISQARLIQELSREELAELLSDAVLIGSPDMPKLVAQLELLGYKELRDMGDGLVKIPGQIDTVTLNRQLVEKGVSVSSIQQEKRTLEDYFFHIIEEDHHA